MATTYITSIDVIKLRFGLKECCFYQNVSLEQSWPNLNTNENNTQFW